MRGILPVIAIIAVIIMTLTLMFPESLRGADSNGTMAALVQACMVAILVGAGLFGSRNEGKIGLRQGVLYGAIWIGIALFLVAAYSQRDSFARLWANIAGEINPSATRSSGQTVTLLKSDDGHFWAQVRINGTPIRMMVDTGASGIALDPADARLLGIDTDKLNFNIAVGTAAGPSRVASVKLDTVALGSIVKDDVTAQVLVTSGGVSLLGMGFLGEVSQVRAAGNTLTIVE